MVKTHLLIGGVVLAVVVAVVVTLVVVLKNKKGKMGGGNPMPLPVLKKGSQPWNVFSVTPKNISVSSEGVKINYETNKQGLDSGGAFKAAPKGLPARTAVLSYSVYIPSSFEWDPSKLEKQGGKFFGLCFGKTQKDCATGGQWQADAGSWRCMWRANGQLIGYIYIPLSPANPDSALAKQNSAFKAVADATERTGINLWFKNPGGTKLQLKKNSWNDISLGVDLGTPGKANGSLWLSCNGVTKRVSDVLMRQDTGVKVSSVDACSFAGGSDLSWAFKQPTYSLFKNFRFAASG